MKEISDHLSSIGKVISDKDLILYVIPRLYPKYKFFTSLLGAKMLELLGATPMTRKHTEEGTNNTSSRTTLVGIGGYRVTSRERDH